MQCLPHHKSKEVKISLYPNTLSLAELRCAHIFVLSLCGGVRSTACFPIHTENFLLPILWERSLSNTDNKLEIIYKHSQVTHN